MKHSQWFRNTGLRKVFPPENRVVYTVAKEVGRCPAQTRILTCCEQKEQTIRLADEAAADGFRVKTACEVLGISFNRFLRRRSGKATDRRKEVKKTAPRNLREEEVQLVLADNGRPMKGSYR